MDDIGECDMKPYVDNGCVGQLIGLLSLDHAPIDPSKSVLQTSNVILSRVSVNYLNTRTTFSDWTICEKHKLQLLDNWRSTHICCHHAHRFSSQNCTLMNTVTYAMSKTILKHDGIVLPIGGNICLDCKFEYQRRHIPALTSIQDLATQKKKEAERGPSVFIKTETSQPKAVASVASQSKPSSQQVSTTSNQTIVPGSGARRLIVVRPVNPPSQSNVNPAQSTLRVIRPGGGTLKLAGSSVRMVVGGTGATQILPGVRLPTAGGNSSHVLQTGNRTHVLQAGNRMQVLKPGNQSISLLKAPTVRLVTSLASPATAVRQVLPSGVVVTPRSTILQATIAATTPTAAIAASAKGSTTVQTTTATAIQTNLDLVKNEISVEKNRDHSGVPSEKTHPSKSCEERGNRSMAKSSSSSSSGGSSTSTDKPAPKGTGEIRLASNLFKPAGTKGISSLASKSTAAKSPSIAASSKAGSTGDEFKFYCEFCHIGFLRESSYRHHMSNCIDIHKRIKRKQGVRKACEECDEIFMGANADREYRQHMHSKHSLDDPFFCKICNILLKNESAYKSHYSKLHLERVKVFYCGECGDVFKCKLEHEEHIASHWEATTSKSGIQCISCGKVFTEGNRSSYVKHLATHDEGDNLRPCDCTNCRQEAHSPAPALTSKTVDQPDEAEETTENPEKDTADTDNNADSQGTSKMKKKQDQSLKRKIEPKSVSKKPTRSKKPRSSKPVSLWEQMDQDLLGDNDNDDEESEDDNDTLTEDEEGSEDFDDDEEDDDDDDDDDEYLPEGEAGDELVDGGGAMSVNCGVCGESFSDVDGLESHVEEKHGLANPATADTGDSEEEEETEATGEEEEEEIESLPAGKPKPGKSSDKSGETTESESAKKGGNKKSSRPSTKDVISSMRSTFTKAIQIDNEEEPEGRSASTAGQPEKVAREPPASKSKPASTQSFPRVISDSSRATRKRLEHLTKLAQQVMREREKKRAEKKREEEKQKQTVVDIDSDDENTMPRGPSKDDLLIPLSNGWVCEKRRDGSAPNGYLTTYWSPEGQNFSSKQQVAEYIKAKNLDINMEVFNKTDLEGTRVFDTRASTMPRVRIKDEETGLPMVIIFPDGKDCLTMDVSATA